MYYPEGRHAIGRKVGERGMEIEKQNTQRASIYAKNRIKIRCGGSEVKR